MAHTVVAVAVASMVLGLVVRAVAVWSGASRGYTGVYSVRAFTWLPAGGAEASLCVAGGSAERLRANRSVVQYVVLRSICDLCGVRRAGIQ